MISVVLPTGAPSDWSEGTVPGGHGAPTPSPIDFTTTPTESGTHAYEGGPPANRPTASHCVEVPFATATSLHSKRVSSLPHPMVNEPKTTIEERTDAADPRIGLQ